MLLKPQFVELNGARLFCLRVLGGPRPRMRVVIAPPFAEELNKCRRLIALIARRLAESGCDVLVPDLFGTGDSEGEFAQASWARWVEDFRAVDAWHAALSPSAPTAYLAIRTGLLVLSAALEGRAGASAEKLIALQPVLDGERFVQQFLRLRAVASKFAGGDETVASLLARLQAGGAVEVGGYELSADLGRGLGAARLTPASVPAAQASVYAEFRTGAAGSPSRPLQELVEGLINAGATAEARVVAAEQFWATQEVSAPEEAVSLVVNGFLGGTPG